MLQHISARIHDGVIPKIPMADLLENCPTGLTDATPADVAAAVRTYCSVQCSKEPCRAGASVLDAFLTNDEDALVYIKRKQALICQEAAAAAADEAAPLEALRDSNRR